ncbi:hypothetical protein [Halomicronema hongdechloris]|nr:hypothetical protein [Halomicronema hongdechloris]
MGAALAALILVVETLGNQRQANQEPSPALPSNRASGDSAATDSDRTWAYPALSLLQGVTAPLVYLQTIQQAMAISDQPASQTGANLATSEVTTTGLGPIQIGMTLDQVKQQGIELVPMDGIETKDCQYYTPKQQVQGVGVMVVNDRIIRIDVWPGSPLETLSGAKIGSTEADLKALYQDQLQIDPHPLTQGHYVSFVPTDEAESIFRLVFETDAAGTVVQYRAGQFPAVTWAEGCL